MALAAGFGLDFERCDPEIFAAVEEVLEKQSAGSRRQRALGRLRKHLGR